MSIHPHSNELLGSVAYGSGATNSGTFQRPAWARGGIFMVDATAVSGTSPTLDTKLQARIPIGEFGGTDDWIDYPGAAFAQITAASTQILTIYPGVAETANVSVSDVVPHEFRVVNTVGGTATPTVTAQFFVSWIR